VKLFNAADSRLRTFQGSCKSPGLIGLIEPRVEPHEAAVTQRQDANDRKEMSAPTEKRPGPCGKKPPPLNFEIHGRVHWLPAMVLAFKGV
jgi:hypothetical protein